MTHAERIKIVVAELQKLVPDIEFGAAMDTAELFISVARKGRLPGEPAPKKEKKATVSRHRAA